MSQFVVYMHILPTPPPRGRAAMSQFVVCMHILTMPPPPPPPPLPEAVQLYIIRSASGFTAVFHHAKFQCCSTLILGVMCTTGGGGGGGEGGGGGDFLGIDTHNQTSQQTDTSDYIQ